MRIRVAVVSAGALVLLGVAAPGFAQGGPGSGPRGRGPGGFGWGREDGVRFLGAGGCFFGEREFGKQKSSTPYELSVERVDVRPVLGPPPGSTTHNDNYSMFRDTNGVTYLETTRNSKTLVCINDPTNHVRFVVTLTAPNTGTALEFKLPTFTPRSGPRPPHPNGGNGQNPPSGKFSADVTHLKDATPSLIGSYVSLPPGSWFTACTGLDLTSIKRGQFQSVRIFCSSLGVDLYTATTGPYGDSTVTATIVTPPDTLTLPQYSPGQTPPLPVGITIKTVSGRGRWQGGPPPQP